MRNAILAGMLAVIAGALAGPASAAQATAVDDLQWHYRVIAVFAPTPGRARRAAHALRHSTGIDERDIAWFVVTRDDITANLSIAVSRESLISVYAGDGFEAVLLGKDGGVKSRQREQLDVGAFFDRIDQMPMRRQEMQEQ